MKKGAVWGTAVISASVLLSGCKILGIHHVAGAQAAAPVQVAAAPADPAPGSALQAGRENLRANRSGLAIESFNLALASGEDPAAAYNGLAVAYSRIGRTDLAYRFFKKAMNSDPLNPIYSRNLAMLIDSPSFTLQTMAQADRSAVAPPAAKPANSLATRGKTEGPRLVRDSGRQFSLLTTDASGLQPADARSAAAAQCNQTKQRTTCPAARLPRIGSRNAAVTSSVAVAEAKPSSASKATKASKSTAKPAPTAEEAAAPAGKRKTVDLSAIQDQPRAPKSKPAAITVTNSKI